MSRESTLNMLGHYVGNYTQIALGDDDKDKQRRELILSLEGLEQIEEVRGALELAQKKPWTSKEDVNTFQGEYRQINPDKEFRTLLSELFGGKK